MDKKIHKVSLIKTDSIYLYLMVDSQAYRILWANCSAKLKAAGQRERDYIDLSPSGYGLHWPLLDEDLAITPLLKQAEPIMVAEPMRVPALEYALA